MSDECSFCGGTWPSDNESGGESGICPTCEAERDRREREELDAQRAFIHELLERLGVPDHRPKDVQP